MTTPDWTTEPPQAMHEATQHLKNGDIVPAFAILGNGMAYQSFLRKPKSYA